MNINCLYNYKYTYGNVNSFFRTRLHRTVYANSLIRFGALPKPFPKIKNLMIRCCCCCWCCSAAIVVESILFYSHTKVVLSSEQTPRNCTRFSLPFHPQAARSSIYSPHYRFGWQTITFTHAVCIIYNPPLTSFLILRLQCMYNSI